MSAALYIVLEEKPADFDPFVNGKALSRAEKDLAMITGHLGVKSLMSFFSVDPEEAQTFLEGEGVDSGTLGVKLPAFLAATPGAKAKYSQRFHCRRS
jgi:hypothetical protein